MTTAHRENDLALYVEGDLGPAEARALEVHLRDCGECRDFLDELRGSQRGLQDLASEAPDEGTMDALRTRIVAARLREPARASAVARLAIAASLAAAVAAAFWLAVPRVPVRPTSSLTPPPAAPLPPRSSAQPESERAAPPSPAPEPVRRAAVQARRAVVPKLSPEDADQLARAVVAVSRIQSVAQALRDAPSPDPPLPLVRLATTDPDVVIYWRMDPNGGD